MSTYDAAKPIAGHQMQATAAAPVPAGAARSELERKITFAGIAGMVPLVLVLVLRALGVAVPGADRWLGPAFLATGALIAIGEAVHAVGRLAPGRPLRISRTLFAAGALLLALAAGVRELGLLPPDARWFDSLFIFAAAGVAAVADAVVGFLRRELTALGAAGILAGGLGALALTASTGDIGLVSPDLEKTLFLAACPLIAVGLVTTFRVNAATARISTD